MNLIIMKGCETLNPVWEKDVLKGYNSDFEKIALFSFNTCAGNYCEGIDLDKEAKNFAKLVNNIDGDFVVFARKIASLVLLKAINEYGLKPDRCVCLGFPISWALVNNHPIDKWLKNYSIPTLFVQRKVDPVFYFSNLDVYLRKHKVQNQIVVKVDYVDKEFDKVDHYRTMALNFLAEK